VRLKPSSLTLLIGLLIAAGGVLPFLVKLTVIELRNLDRPQVRLIRVSPGERFRMFYRHSIYDADVAEEFEVRTDALILRGVRTESPRVMEYYGFDSVIGFHPLEIRFKAPLIIRRGISQDQGFVFLGKRLFLHEIAEKGDRIRLRLTTVSWGAYGLAKFPGAHDFQNPGGRLLE